MNAVISYMFPLIALLVLCGLNYYLARRCFQCVKFLAPNISQLLVILIFIVLMLVMILGFIRSLLPIPTIFKNLLAQISAYSMGAFVYLLLFMVLADIVLVICHLLKIFSMTVPVVRFVSGMAVMVLAVITVVYGTYHARQLKIVTYDVTVENKTLEKDWNIVMISDLHLGAIGSEEYLEKIVNEINNLNPDLVCIAGDFFDSDYNAIQNPKKAMEVLKQLKTKYGIYVCLGNHDAGDTALQMQQFLEQSNIQMLNDTYTIIQDELVLVGRLDSSPIGGYAGMTRKNVSEVLAGIDTNLPIMVMDHNPANIGEYSGEIDLIVSGHTHKGQIFPGNLITDAMYTVDHGYYQANEDRPQVIVTSGVGTWGMPIRVGTDSEIVQIMLHP